MKRFTLLMIAMTILTTAHAEELPSGDARTDWNCVYPYTDTNCQNVLLAWSKDMQVPGQEIIDGMECSGCDSTYYTDSQGQKHLIYAKCLNRFGAKFTEPNLIASITKYKQANGDGSGWAIVDWRFAKCFETWQCGDFCSLQTDPPHCLRYYTTNWGKYVPVVGKACEYGNGGSAPPSEPQPSMPTSPIPRDDTWTPVY
jgi:hypothetical protein